MSWREQQGRKVRIPLGGKNRREKEEGFKVRENNSETKIDDGNSKKIYTKKDRKIQREVKRERICKLTVVRGSIKNHALSALSG